MLLMALRLILTFLIVALVLVLLIGPPMPLLLMALKVILIWIIIALALGLLIGPKMRD